MKRSEKLSVEVILYFDLMLPAALAQTQPPPPPCPGSYSGQRRYDPNGE